MQTDLAIEDGAFTGTLKFLSGGEIAGYWGDGNFMAVKITDIADNITSVKVGMTPSEGSGLVELDEDCNAVCKVTDKDTQLFTVQISDGYYTHTDYYDLSGLTCETTQGG